MSPRKRILLLIFIMCSIVIFVEAITISILYQTAIKEEKFRLQETANSHALCKQIKILNFQFRFRQIRNFVIFFI